MITQYHISSGTVGMSSNHIRCKEENRHFKEKLKKEKKENVKEEQESEQKSQER